MLTGSLASFLILSSTSFLLFSFFSGTHTKMIRTKEESLRSASREARAKDLEIASLRGDLAGEQRLKVAAEAKLSEAYSERDKVSMRCIVGGGAGLWQGGCA